MKTKFILISILLLAALFRLYKLGSIPPHLTPDEAAIGYNAYSIAKTGHDEYGQYLPLIFKSFGDYKPGLYIYTTAPFVALLGLDEFSTRLPSALAGVLAVWLFYLLIKEFINLSSQKSKNINYNLACIGCFMLAISPWHIHFSRGAWEVNLALTLTLAAILFFIKSFQKHKYIFISSILFASTLYTYHGGKLSSAIALLILFLTFYKKLFSYPKKYLLVAASLLILLSIPSTMTLFDGRAGRLSVFSIFSFTRPTEYVNGILSEGNENIPSLSYYLFHSEFLSTSKGILGRWFNHFSPRFLFFEGDWQNPRHSIPNHGMLLLSDMIVLVFGFYFVVKNKINNMDKFFLLWLVLSPLPSILSRDQIHAVRSLNMLLPLAYFVSRSVEYLYSYSQKIVYFLIPLIFFSFIYFLDSYFVHLSIHNSKYWEYGYKQSMQTVIANQNKYNSIIIQQSYSQPYIYYLFYSKYDPNSYAQKAHLVAGESVLDVGKVEHLDNICFCPIDWSVNRGKRNTLFVADTIRIPPGDSNDTNHFNVLSEIRFLDNQETALRVVEVK